MPTSAVLQLYRDMNKCYINLHTYKTIRNKTYFLTTHCLKCMRSIQK